MAINYWRLLAAMVVSAAAMIWGYVTFQFIWTAAVAGPDPFVDPYLNEVWANGVGTMLCAQGLALALAAWAGSLWSRTFRD